MKNILAILVSAAWIAVSSPSLWAEQWALSGSKEQPSNGLKASETPSASVFSIAPNGSTETSAGTSVAPFIPTQLDQFVISLLDVTTKDNVLGDNQIPLLSRFQFNTGIMTERYLSDPQSLLMEELLPGNSDPFQNASSFIFVGMGLDFNSIYLKGNAYIGRPLDPLSNKLQNSEPVENQGVDTDAYGFKASAGYQLSNLIALGAGFGKMTDKNHETDQTEEVYAVYAQAILAVAPGVQVKPEVGKVDRIKEETDTEKIDQSFYAGAIWEINF